MVGILARLEGILVLRRPTVSEDLKISRTLNSQGVACMKLVNYKKE